MAGVSTYLPRLLNVEGILSGDGFSMRSSTSVSRPSALPFFTTAYLAASSRGLSCTPMTLLPVNAYASISCARQGFPPSLTITSSPYITAKGSSSVNSLASMTAFAVPVASS